MDKELKIEQPLSSDRQPVKVGDKVSGLLLKDKDVIVENDVEVGNDLTVGSTLTVTSPIYITNLSGSTLSTDADYIVIKSALGGIQFWKVGVYGGAIFGDGTDFAILPTTNSNIIIKTLGTGDLILDAANGNYIAKYNGTEFSAADSAYAGMILGYTRLMGDGTNQNVFEIEDDITVEDATHKITFKTPPSELVEIEAQVMINNSSTDTNLTTGLSDNATYNSIGIEHEYDYLGLGFSDDEVDDHLHNVKWVLDADDLEAVGADNELWVGFGTAGVTKTAFLTYGVRASHGICTAPFIIKATALPATIYDGQ